ncbi:MAG: hypothetical protein JAY60_13455 [Candidatus Thiodiazotropha weberae]|nr:hypothetical protein [Candidatus Thiodiazotropha weberae]
MNRISHSKCLSHYAFSLTGQDISSKWIKFLTTVYMFTAWIGTQKIIPFPMTKIKSLFEGKNLLLASELEPENSQDDNSTTFAQFNKYDRSCNGQGHAENRFAEACMGLWLRPISSWSRSNGKPGPATGPIG